ncbi:hypothetical protein KC343_g2884 [Hortaea werneckii]|uniref:DUF6590 domain-containing protein n=1 Tax=Hortaea werneckii TaxID=91943 RepID=A0A3M7ELR8_HORWE|nr:hypothetical protein KC352_g8220 [Hortaea werneckii]KAI7569707.1 hypothetical protein KC317_g3095 [Hortaea werneckii]KAI7623578.1 hypothetical protein KC346_g2669 [Hortaea werneckii]KAI7633534.1 hypothetical protein KC343_g2884 [Hortaea werneckii]KAI7679747.1 hypothetical protein KC319_g2594 [Hortaea werneckii]
MAQQPSSSGWQHSQSLGQWVWYDAQRNRYILPDGSVLPSSTQPQSPGSSTAQGLQYTLASAGPSAQGDANSSIGANALVGDLANLTIDQRSVQTTSRVHNGIRWVDARNPDTGVSTWIATDPPNLITEPGLWGSGRGGGVRAHRMLAGNSQQETEVLYPSYKLRQKQFFKEGRVFLILWTEPAGEPTATTRVTDRQSPEVNAGITHGLHGQRVFSKVRRFVIIREGDLSCSALPITTYGGQGVSKPGVRKSDHAIIFTGRSAPQPRQDELPARDEQPMRDRAICVVADENNARLDPMSRIDLVKIHTINHNLKVKSFGFVHPNYMEALKTQFASVWPVLRQPQQQNTTVRQAAVSVSNNATTTSRYWANQFGQLCTHYRGDRTRAFAQLVGVMAERSPDLTRDAAATRLRTYLASAQQPRPAAAASPSVGSSGRTNQQIMTIRHPDTIPRATLSEQEDNDSGSQNEGTDDEDEDEVNESVSATHSLRAS